mmetsp:Transcript_56242/g.131742  ORF Transcript_56242/g.131742 Transcript_56242/m.131742 type:complete len:251 (-) Transcript_56242:757-1509(-)
MMATEVVYVGNSNEALELDADEGLEFDLSVSLCASSSSKKPHPWRLRSSGCGASDLLRRSEAKAAAAVAPSNTGSSERRSVCCQVLLLDFAPERALPQARSSLKACRGLARCGECSLSIESERRCSGDVRSWRRTCGLLAASACSISSEVELSSDFTQGLGSCWNSLVASSSLQCTAWASACALPPDVSINWRPIVMELAFACITLSSPCCLAILASAKFSAARCASAMAAAHSARKLETSLLQPSLNCV